MTKILQGICRTYISIIRGTPMLVQIFIIFYGLPEVGIKLEPFPTAIIAFSINIGAYAAETVRASILAIPKGQWGSLLCDRHELHSSVRAYHYAASVTYFRPFAIKHLH